MGQRHQLFIIARLRPHGAPDSPPMYRCVAAHHHQWNYGRRALRAVRRVLTLVKQKENADIIHAEINNLHGKYGRWREKPKMPSVPAPFIAFLLGIACTCDLRRSDPEVDGYDFFSGVLTANMGSWEGGELII